VAQLRKLMCDEIKVDDSFVRDLEKEAPVQAMLLGIGDLARRLRLNCVACGIETQAQLGFLKKNSWDQGQGRFFGEPMTGLNFAAKWLARGGKTQRVPMPGE
jgi:EAL domain-containing protein (putative c-di-GMP-specific phosphodiesterase class I)